MPHLPTSILALLLSGCIGDGKPDDTSGAAEVDADADGYAAGDDCDDGNAAVHPGATEICDPGDVDEDCSGTADNADPGATGTIQVLRDADADGWGVDGTEVSACEVTAGYAAIGGDCDDTDPTINPEGTEVCDAADVDEDCDGAVDDADPSVEPAGMEQSWRDADGDTYGDAEEVALSCDPAAGWVSDATDCDDAAATVYPGADERCNGVDDDCDTVVDEDDAVDAPTWYLDDDGDGYGDPSATRIRCEAPSGYVAEGTDCDDLSSGVHPGADEHCDGEDDDCDGDIDEDDATDVVTWYADADGDGWGDADRSTIDCDAPTGYVADAGDCADADAAIHPDATEACDTADADEDCDGSADDADGGATGKTAWYADTDGDGFGDPDVVTAACDRPSGSVADDSDCDDTDPLVNPDGAEVCDADDTDEDCDGLVDDLDDSVDPSGLATWYVDADADGYGAASGSTAACDLPSGYASTATDCDDTDPARSPARTEVCDAADLDEDCDGLSDDADAAASGKSTWYLDLDGDGYGDESASVLACGMPSGYAATAGDCDDGDGDVNPGATEDCASTTDENCDGVGLCDVSVADADRIFQGAAGDVVGTTVGSEDLDGDGVEELLVGGSGAYASAGAIFVFAGGGTGDSAVSGAAGVVRGLAAGDVAYGPVAGLGDIDGDGFGDLGLVDPYDNSGGTYAGSVRLFRGPVSGTSTLAASYADLAGTSAYDYVYALAAVGDHDGDALGDLLVGAPGYYGDGRAYLFTGLGTAPAGMADATATFTPESSSGYLGSVVAAVGDGDGDGLDDIVVGDANAGGGRGRLYYFAGPQTGTVAAASADGVRNASSGAYAASWTARKGGDVDADGYDDLAVTETTTSATDTSVWILSGPLTGTASISTAGARIRDRSAGSFGRAVGCDGDFDGDGYADVAVGDTYDSDVTGYAGSVTLYFGPLTGALAPADADVTLNGDAYSQLVGSSLAFVGPQSGSTDELLIGASYDPTYGSYAGAAYLVSLGGL